jgi:hypothetical protein
VIELFKQKNPANLLLLLIAGFLIKIPMFLHPHGAIVRPGDGILYEGIINFFSATAKSNPILYPLLAFALLFIQAAMLTRFINFTADDEQVHLPPRVVVYAGHFAVARVELFFCAPVVQHVYVVYTIGVVRNLQQA